jgi:hypothetical protein
MYRKLSKFFPIGILVLGFFLFSYTGYSVYTNPKLQWEMIDPLEAQNIYNNTGYEAITINSTTAGGFTTAKYFTASTGKIVSDYVFCRLETGQIRFTLDGTTPTASVGILLQVGETLTLDNYDDLSKFKGFAVSTPGSLRCTYKKKK